MKFSLLAFVCGLGLSLNTQIVAPVNSQLYYISQTAAGPQIFKVENSGSENSSLKFVHSAEPIQAVQQIQTIPQTTVLSAPQILQNTQYVVKENIQPQYQTSTIQNLQSNPSVQYILPVSSTTSGFTLNTQTIQPTLPTQSIQIQPTVQPVQLQQTFIPLSSQPQKSIQPINVDGKWYAYSTNLINGRDNMVSGYYNKIQGQNNVLAGQDNDINGQKNKIQGTKNKISGLTNLVSGKNNVIGSRNKNVFTSGNDDLFGDFFSDAAFWGTKSIAQGKTQIFDEKCQ